MGNTLSSAFIPTPPPRDLFLNLPEELLLVIIHSLGDTNSQIYLSRVNKRFHRIVMPEVWKKSK
ncbi:hypothetical protein PHISCL_00887 [Aspergillus sclerotialis]|uniref:F-box domain-containing protein n=1 Tax=Aspergillus sclerotialis TaxID=2070753 RepID=A0A3A3A9T5_9EURO|nr:hypothetical protein PHISCL_00887 [Aspergillus sclerotialis]